MINHLTFLNDIKRSDSFLNAHITYKIILTIPMSVASSKRNFSKLKIIKIYLTSMIFQQKSNGLVILFTKKKILNTINYDN